MSGIKRYAITHLDWDMAENPNGDYIKTSDLDAGALEYALCALLEKPYMGEEQKSAIAHLQNLLELARGRR